MLIDNMIEMVNGDKLYIAPYSESLFEDKEVKLKVKNNPLKAADENWCFIENLPVAEYKDEIETVVIYHWNRHYPGDFFFDLELDSYTLESSEELVGSSHEKITKEIWNK